MSCIVRLASTGQEVSLGTEDGANAFLEQTTGADGFNFFSAELKTANTIRKRERKKGKLNNSDRQRLRYIYVMMLNVVSKAEPKLFREKVPKGEIEAYLNHAVEIFQHITNDRKWINTGNLLHYDHSLMVSLAFLFDHPTAVELIFDNISLLETISEMMCSLEKPPSTESAFNLIVMVENIYLCSRKEMVPNWKAEKAFKKLESTGILEHYLRCTAVDDSFTASPTFGELLTCTAYVKKYFKEGTPCGNAIREIVKGRNGQPPSAPIIPYMNSLIQYSTGEVDYHKAKNVNDCDFCDKNISKETIKRCAKCLQASYCSKECQVADWKAHKKICGKSLSSREEKNADVARHLVKHFLTNHYMDIMFRFVEESDKAGGLNFEEMILELDMLPDSDGNIPLLQDPPIFQVVPLPKYVDGSWFNDPRCVFAGKSLINEEQQKQSFLATLKDRQSRRKPKQLLYFIYLHKVFAFVCYEKKAETGSTKHIFCQEALEAFRSLVRDKDFSLLWEIIRSEESRQRVLGHFETEELQDYIFPQSSTPRPETSPPA